MSYIKTDMAKALRTELPIEQWAEECEGVKKLIAEIEHHKDFTDPHEFKRNCAILLREFLLNILADAGQAFETETTEIIRKYESRNFKNLN